MLQTDKPVQRSVPADDDVHPNMELIPGGTFRMGSVFVPQAPTPMAGNVRYFPADRVRPLDVTMLQARAIVKNIGVGSATALRGANLSSPGA